MASKQKFSTYDGESWVSLVSNHIWGIDAAVGWGCTNEESDVLLVQYLLNKTSKNSKTKILEMDGLFGKKTAGAIRKYQKYARTLCGAVHVDGKIDTYKGRNLSTISETFYTIIVLNMQLAEINSIYFFNPKVDPDLPNLLANVLDRPRRRGKTELGDISNVIELR